MGIAGLRDAIRHHGLYTRLSDKTVVIDGPGLVWEILKGCFRLRPPPSKDVFVYQPSYSQLGRLTIGWLDELQRHNVHVRKIYFDGYLPPDKWPTRIYRLRKESTHILNWTKFYPQGSLIVPESRFADITPDISLARRSEITHGNDGLQVTFLIPAVLDVLTQSERWGPLVQVVPGEADIFCAESVREQGGTVLTCDSDFLVADLGPDGAVTFLDDIAEADDVAQTPSLMARQFSTRQISDSLGLANVGGLPRLAYERRSKMTYGEALRRARENYLDRMNSVGFQEFIREHSLTEYLPRDHRVNDILSTLDPRLSELVIQSLLLNTNAIDDIKTCRGPKNLAMFMPIILDDDTRKSVWKLSRAVRQIAYGALQMITPSILPVVNEYQTVRDWSRYEGTQVKIPHHEEIIRLSSLLAETLEELSNHLSHVESLWLTFAVYQDIVWANDQDGHPHLLSLMAQVNAPTDALGPTPATYSWDTIRGIAQIHASLYSLRMCKQALEVAAHLCTEALPDPMLRLRDLLKSLPSIVEWPTAETMPQVLQSLRRSESLISTALGVSTTTTQGPGYVGSSSGFETIGPRKRSVNQIGASKRGRVPFAPASANRFDVLRTEGWTLRYLPS